ncbi:uncharacterized protein PpBr36_10768 [Pyricularia pennisetigena]|uniref:uncharacterized protein n=1 Tax=Pyricularia pennisetigena TaxID=1578925 RepID=UPI001153C58B|nr:uncharacterized protein PpBr36_10768 [Pyricularia pennisetigena]TLS21027.1 hypothetical protein PpBr36_10768 [Pyricularia pennisetigena]
MTAYWSDPPNYPSGAHTAWPGAPLAMAPTYTTSNAYYDPDQQYEDDSPTWPSQQLQLYQPALSPPIKYDRYPTHRRKHHRRHRPASPSPVPPTPPTSEAQLAAYAAHCLIPALQASTRPLSVFINHGHAVVPESAVASDGSGSSIVYNAPGCTLMVARAASARASHETQTLGRKDGGSDALLRACRTCGVLRVVDSVGSCRDCGAGRAFDDDGAEWRGDRRGVGGGGGRWVILLRRRGRMAVLGGS